MMVVAVFFTVCAVLSVILLKMVRLAPVGLVWFSSRVPSERKAYGVATTLAVFQVHSHYRRTGASFQKAQQEFSQGVLTNRTFQTAAANAASSAAQSSFQRN